MNILDQIKNILVSICAKKYHSWPDNKKYQLEKISDLQQIKLN